MQHVTPRHASSSSAKWDTQVVVSLFESNVAAALLKVCRNREEEREEGSRREGRRSRRVA